MLAFHIPFADQSLALLFIGGLVLLASAFWVWMLVDALTSTLPSTEKLIWVLVILFTHLLGAILYFAIARGSPRGGVGP